VSSLSDFLNTGSSGPSLGTELATMVPQYRINETLPNLQEDAAIASQRGIQDFQQRTLPQMQSDAASTGQAGSSGANLRQHWAGIDQQRSQNDIARMLFRNTANIAQQKVLASYGQAGF
jgi:hypothetical protein